MLGSHLVELYPIARNRETARLLHSGYWHDRTSRNQFSLSPPVVARHNMPMVVGMNQWGRNQWGQTRLISRQATRRQLVTAFSLAQVWPAVEEKGTEAIDRYLGADAALAGHGGQRSLVG
jgi:hypothetical protein